MDEYDDDLIENIVNNIDLVDFISEYLPLEKRGNEWFAECPFHDEKTASFSVNHSVYYCFGCGAKGNIISFCTHYLHMRFDETIKYLSGIAGIDIENGKREVSQSVKFLKKLRTARKKIETSAEPHKIIDPYILTTFEHERIVEWEKEGIPQEIMEHYGVAYDKRIDPRKSRIVYPVYDLNGNLINVKGRTLCEDYKKLSPPIPKYINYYPVGDLDYFQGLNFKYDEILRIGEIIIFESFKSVMKADSFGYINSVSAETSSLTIYQVRLLISMHVDVVICFDTDIPFKKVISNDKIRILSKFTNLYIVFDKQKILGDPSLKNSPVDCGKEKWEQLYGSRFKI